MQEQKKKLLITTGIFPPDIGGPATYVKTLLDELPKHGFEVKVITYSSENYELLITNYNQIYRVSRKQNVLARYFKFFTKTFQLIKWADIVYTQGPISEGLPTYLACKLRGKEYILKITGDQAWERHSSRKLKVESRKFIGPDEFQEKRFGFKTEVLRKIQKLVAKNAQLVITPSEYLKKIVKMWGVDEDRIKVIYNSVEKIKLDPDKQTAKKNLGLKGDIILSAGRLVSWKGMDTLINLMPGLLQINPNFKLLIAGSGNLINNYKLLINNLGLTGKVILLGKVEQKKLWQYMRASEMFVLNTAYEGLSHILIEAMQIGAPIITTKVGGNGELIKNRETGVLVEYNNAEELKKTILELWKNQGWSQELAQNAQVEARDKFMRERMIGEVIKVLK